MTLQTERLSLAHLGEVAQLERLCFTEPWSEKSLELLVGESAVGFVCLCGGHVLAYGGMLIAPDEGQITNIATHPDARRMGMGRVIVNALIAEAKSRKLEQIALEVRVSNTAAIRLYEGLGFVTVGRRKGFYRKPTEDGLIMLKYIK